MLEFDIMRAIKERMAGMNSQLELTKMAIDSAKNDVVEEMERTGQSWNICFRSSVFAVELFLATAKQSGELIDGKYNKYRQRLDRLREQNNTNGLDETKRLDLLTKLNVFNEEVWEEE